MHKLKFTQIQAHAFIKRMRKRERRERGRGREWDSLSFVHVISYPKHMPQSEHRNENATLPSLLSSLPTCLSWWSYCCSSEYSSFLRYVLQIIWFLNSVQLLHQVLNQKRKKCICSKAREKNWLYWPDYETVYQFPTWHLPKGLSRASLPTLNFCLTCWL